MRVNVRASIRIRFYPSLHPAAAAAQRDSGRPTRRVYVTRTLDGDRAFGGFPGPADSFADCHTDIG